MQRIEKFMIESEVPEWASSLQYSPCPDHHLSLAITKNATFKWSPDLDDDDFVLGPINVSFPPGELSLIIGNTGSGKTSLLLALLGGKRQSCTQNTSSDQFHGRATLCRRSSYYRQVRTKCCILLAKSL